MEPIHVICFGTVLLGDDGAGIHAYRRLERRSAPGVRVLDGGVLGVTALGLFEGCREAFVVDAVEDDAPPGTVVRFPLERAGRRRPPRTSHAATVDELVDLLPIVLGDRAPPPITVYGVVVDRGAVRPGLELSAAVDAGVVEVCARLAVELAERTARRVRRAW